MITNFFFKLRVLFLCIRDGQQSGFIFWKENIYPKDPDQRYCCNGHECGCEGATIRDLWTTENKVMRS
jgi:hypothetical protein